MSDTSPKKPNQSMHYAWNADTNTRKAELESLGVVNAPVQVSKPEAETVTTPGASAWNKAGTWEEKNVTKSATALLKSTLATKLDAPDGYQLEITEVDVEKEYANLIFSRGRLRLGFEYELTLAWDLKKGSDTVSQGNISIPEMADYESEVFETMNVTVNSSSGVSSTESITLVKTCDDAIREKIRSWIKAVCDGSQ